MKLFDSVAKLKLARLQPNQFVETGGYYEKGGDGAAKYFIKTETQALADGDVLDGFGNHELANGNWAIVQGLDDWVTPEVFGAVGDGINDDSLNIVSYLSAVRKQLWTPTKTYILNAVTTGDNRAFRVYSDTEMFGYGAIINLQGTTNNGFYFSDADGSLFRNQIRGFRFIQSDPNAITSAITIEGFVNYMVIEGCVALSLDQYFIGLGGVNSGYNYLTVRNNTVTNLNSQNDNEFSLCYEFFPQQPSSMLKFHGNYGEQTGWGGCFKIHTATDSYIFDNTFIRTTNVGNSQSQAVMLGGRPTNPCNRTFFHNNRIFDANTALSALFIGNTSDITHVQDNVVEGGFATVWVGNGASNVRICGNTMGGIFSISSQTNAFNNVLIENNQIGQINFQAPAGGSAPDTINNLKILGNTVSGSLRIDSAGASNDVVISDNVLSDINQSSFMYADNIEFKGNKISANNSWSAGTQIINANGANYRQMNNTWDLKGLVAQTTWLNGTTDAQVVGETVEDAATRLVLDNGTNTDIFDNRLRLAGVWSIV